MLDLLIFVILLCYVISLHTIFIKECELLKEVVLREFRSTENKVREFILKDTKIREFVLRDFILREFILLEKIKSDDILSKFSPIDFIQINSEKNISEFITLTEHEHNHDTIL
jgi:hypothetical protein